MLSLNNRMFGRICLLTSLLYCAVCLQGCNPFASPSNNSNSTSPKDVKTFSRGLEALIDPPPTDDPGGRRLRVEEVKSKLEISSLKQAAIVLAPRKDKITIESIELAIYSGDGKEKIFSIRSSSASDRRTFDPINRSTPNISGYVFNLDPQKIAEADKYFVAGNTIKLLPLFEGGKPILATLYIVGKQSKMLKKE